MILTTQRTMRVIPPAKSDFPLLNSQVFSLAHLISPHPLDLQYTPRSLPSLTPRVPLPIPHLSVPLPSSLNFCTPPRHQTPLVLPKKKNPLSSKRYITYDSQSCHFQIYHHILFISSLSKIHTSWMELGIGKEIDTYY